jgi:hypothetical protein
MSEQPDPDQFDFEGYRRFIGQLSLRNVWLVAARIDNRAGPATPPHARIVIDDESSWSAIEGGFRVSIRYRLRFRAGSRVLATFETTFAADYASSQPMSDTFFAPFKEANLPLNTWPYLRAFVANSLGRMGWTPFTLPAFKVNVDRDTTASESTSAPPRRRSSTRASAGAGARSESESSPE